MYVSLSVFKMHLTRRYTYLDRHGPEMVGKYMGAVDRVQITQVYPDVQSVLLGGSKEYDINTLTYTIPSRNHQPLQKGKPQMTG